MAIDNILSLIQQKLVILNNSLDEWSTPWTSAVTHGPCSLIRNSTSKNTILLKPTYSYSTPHTRRVWIGSNNIPYTEDYDGLQLAITAFVQVNSGATVNIVVYDTESDIYHDPDSAYGAWFLKWSQFYPHNDSLALWPFLPAEVDLKTFFTNKGIVGTFTTLDIPSSEQEIDGNGNLVDDKWQVIRSDYLTLPTSTLERKIGVFIEIIFKSPNLTDAEANCYFSIPCVSARYSYTTNEMGFYTYNIMPEVFRNNDSLSETVDYRLHRLLDVLTHMSDVSDEFVENWRYFDILDGFSSSDINTYSKLVSTEYSPLSNLIWLSQFVNSKREYVQPTSTPWSAIPNTWTQIINILDVNEDNKVTWTEVETYAPGFTILESFLRWAISTGYVSYKAGNKEALTETVKFFLQGSKNIKIEQYNSSSPGSPEPFYIKLYTEYVDTPDATMIGGTSEIVQAAIAISKPIGVEIVHEIVGSI